MPCLGRIASAPLLRDGRSSGAERLVCRVFPKGLNYSTVKFIDNWSPRIVIWFKVMDTWLSDTKHQPFCSPQD